MTASAENEIKVWQFEEEGAVDKWQFTTEEKIVEIVNFGSNLVALRTESGGVAVLHGKFDEANGQFEPLVIAEPE